MGDLVTVVGKLLGSLGWVEPAANSFAAGFFLRLTLQRMKIKGRRLVCGGIEFRREVATVFE